MRVRAVQDVPAENALRVMYAYKGIIRDHLKERAISPDDAMRMELESMDGRCDALALLAFGMYVQSREAFHTARMEDMRRRNAQMFRLVKRHGLAIPDEENRDTRQRF